MEHKAIKGRYHPPVDETLPPLDRRDPAGFIRRATIVARPHLVPEIQLHLITDACVLWRATERDLERIGLDPPFWAFAWPGGQALARYILDHPFEVAGRSVLDFGAGGGVEAIAAAKAGAKSVVASDIDPLAVAALRLNAERNEVTIEATDTNYLGRRDSFDIILCGDVFYDASFAGEVMSWLEQQNARVLIGDPGRGRVDPEKVREIAVFNAPADIDSDGSITKRTSVLELK